MDHSRAAASHTAFALTRTVRVAGGPHRPSAMNPLASYVTVLSSQFTSSVTLADPASPATRWVPLTVPGAGNRFGNPTSGWPGGVTRTLPMVPSTGFGFATDHVTTHSRAAKSHVADVVIVGLTSTAGVAAAAPVAGTARKARAPSNANVFMETDANTGR